MDVHNILPKMINMELNYHNKLLNNKKLYLFIVLSLLIIYYFKIFDLIIFTR